MVDSGVDIVFNLATDCPWCAVSKFRNHCRRRRGRALQAAIKAADQYTADPTDENREDWLRNCQRWNGLVQDIRREEEELARLVGIPAERILGPDIFNFGSMF